MKKEMPGCVWWISLIGINLVLIGLGLTGGEIRSVDDAAEGLLFLAALDMILAGAGAYMFGGREE